MQVSNRYTVRKQSSGRTFSETFIVWDKVSKSRVSTQPARTRETAQHEADRHNVQAMIADYAQDPRPYEARKAEAEAAYRAARTA
jgi:hypothetical protein